MELPDNAWRVIDALTTKCPLCAFLRGLTIGMAAGCLLMLVA